MILGGTFVKYGVVLLFVFGGLAGCLSDGESKTDGVRVWFEDQGGVQGVVLDDQELPVVNATIHVGEEERARTNDTGHFRIVPLEPGRHRIWAAKENFQDSATDVDVVAGQFTSVVLHVEYLPGKQPFHEILIESGLIQCGFAFTDPVRFDNSHFAACAVPGGYAGVDTGDKFETFFEMGGAFNGGQTGFWAETEWDSTQLFGRGMKVIWWITEQPVVEDVQDLPRVQLHTLAGESPLRVRSAAGPFVDPDRSICLESPSCYAMATHYPSANNTNTMVDIGFTMDQQYTDYYTGFFNTPVPVEFSALPDE